MKLNEDIFDNIELEVPDVEVDTIEASELEPEGPELGEDTGIVNIIHDLIIDENEAIQGYNNAAANMESYPELVEIMHDIAGEEYAHIGELQKALELLSPNVENIKEGEVEVELETTEPEEVIEESLTEDKASIKSAIKDLLDFLDSWYKNNIAPATSEEAKEAGWTDEAQKAYLNFYNEFSTKTLTEDAKIIHPRERKTDISYNRVFQRIGDYNGNGFSFSCDKDGNLLNASEAAMKNFKACLADPEHYEDYGVVEHKHTYMENAIAECSNCGTEFELYDEYLGACECPNCGQWYNLSGQELNPVNTWHNGPDW